MTPQKKGLNGVVRKAALKFREKPEIYPWKIAKRMILSRKNENQGARKNCAGDREKSLERETGEILKIVRKGGSRRWKRVI